MSPSGLASRPGSRRRFSSRSRHSSTSSRGSSPTSLRGSRASARTVSRWSSATPPLVISTEFFDRFRSLNVRSNDQLDALVAEAQRAVRGIGAQDLRDGGGLRQSVATQLSRVQTSLDAMLIERPRSAFSGSRPARGEHDGSRRRPRRAGQADLFRGDPPGDPRPPEDRPRQRRRARRRWPLACRPASLVLTRASPRPVPRRSEALAAEVAGPGGALAAPADLTRPPSFPSSHRFNPSRTPVRAPRLAGRSCRASRPARPISEDPDHDSDPARSLRSPSSPASRPSPSTGSASASSASNPRDLEPEDLRLVVDCPFCGRPVPYPGLVRDGSPALAECADPRCDVYFDFAIAEVYAAGTEAAR